LIKLPVYTEPVGSLGLMSLIGFTNTLLVEPETLREPDGCINTTLVDSFIVALSAIIVIPAVYA